MHIKIKSLNRSFPFINVVLVLLMLFSTYSCKQETEIDVPLVFTGEVTEISESGVILNAKVANVSSDILEYGFILKKDQRSKNEGIIFLDNEDFNLYVKYNLNSGLKKDTTYNIRAFIQTKEGTGYGNYVSFTSSGSLPSELNKFSPDFGPVGTKVVIEGKNFGFLKEDIKVQFGNVTAVIDSVSKEKLFVTIPQLSISENVKVAVESAGKVSYSQDLFQLWFPWANTGNNNNFWCESYFQIENQGYIIYRGELKTYNLEIQTWEKTSNLPSECEIAVLSTALNKKAYVLFNNGFWEYEPESEKWTRRKYPPGLTISGYYNEILYNERYQFFLTNTEDKILLGSFNDNKLWEFDTVKNVWVQNKMLPDNIAKNPVGSFSLYISGNVYLGLSSTSGNEFWKYNPENSSLVALGTIPLNSYSFWGITIIDDELFLGLGKNDSWPSESSNEMWKYNFALNKWEQFQNCPEQSFVAASFCYNHKGYFITSWHTWEFDPSKN